jgi:hypothetical protein
MLKFTSMRLSRVKTLLKILVISLILFVLSSIPTYERSVQSYPSTACGPGSAATCGQPYTEQVNGNGWPMHFYERALGCGGVICHPGITPSQLVFDIIVWFLIAGGLYSGYRVVKKAR